MEKKYSFRGILSALLFSILYFAVYLIIQVASVYLLAWLYPYPGLVEQMSIELTIVGNCLCILAFALIFKFTDTPLSEKSYVNPFPSRFVLTMIILGVSAAYGVALILGMIQMSGILPEEWFNVQNDTYSDVMTASGVLQFFSVGLMAPLLEEILFRGLILGTLKQEMHPWAAILLSSLAFGAAHGTAISFIYATGIGILMGWLFVKFNSVLPSIVFHVAYNCALAFSEGINGLVALLSIPIMILSVISIKKYFRGSR